MPEAFEQLFVELIQNALCSVHLYIDQIPRKRKRGTTTPWPWSIGRNAWTTYVRPFNEDDVQWVAENAKSIRPAACPPVIINKKHGEKLPDYRFAAPSSPTFEVKGPVRRTFFDPSRFGKNWTKPPDAEGGSVRKDIRKILTYHCRDFAAVPHYLVLLLPCSIETLPPTFDTIMAMMAAENPGIEQYNWRFEQVWIPARTTSGIVEQAPLTIALSAITRADVVLE
jgi:hypothetical protein